jgi:hypothetical protein
MSSEQAIAQLRESAITILRDAACVFAEEAAESGGAEPLAGEVIEATIEFQAPEPGCVYLRVPTGLAAVLAANLLGGEPDDPASIQESAPAVAELLNMIGGTLMERRLTDRAAGHLGLPSVRSWGDVSECPAPAGAATIALVTDEGDRVDLLLSFGPRA